ncbi:cysteine--tRNA ligase [Candidatus Falkowbacteria bacterium]|nr:cysteine--tRNA ligase [Candidatus Falkowbacteria bacterium]
MFKLYNSLTKQKENFKSLAEEKNKKKLVTMYTCGPTVYDYVHIGNLRSFLVADLLRRFLEFKGYKVKHVMNITDVGHMVADAETGEDKMEAAARREKKDPWQIAEFFTKAFFADIKRMNFLKADKYPKATDHIKEMIKIILKLIKNGYAYEANGSVYFDLSKFSDWGKLSGNKLEDLIAGARVEINPEKKHPYDFALWIKNPSHIMQWNSPWGKGYPGWHIECSAMSMKYLGETIDIHTGGEDNKFPHHESEIAQSEGATGCQFVRFWLHVKHLMVDGEKMSKSKNNFYTLGQILEKGYSPRALRYLLISSHYRDSLNFTFDGLEAAETALQRLDETWTKISEAVSENKNGKGESLVAAAEIAEKEFGAALDDDLNISGAFAALFNFIRKINAKLTSGVSKKELVVAKKALLKMDGVLGLGFQKIKAEKISEQIKKLLGEREQARKIKDWKRADEVRAEIEKLGYTVLDTAEGQKVKTKT